MMCLYDSATMLSHLNLSLKGFLKGKVGTFLWWALYTTKQAGHSQQSWCKRFIGQLGSAVSQSGDMRDRQTNGKVEGAREGTATGVHF